MTGCSTGRWPSHVTQLQAVDGTLMFARLPIDVCALCLLRWLMPMTNAHGYANYRREENSMDPNRDFPYLQRSDRCMQTQTARAVNDSGLH